MSKNYKHRKKKLLRKPLQEFPRMVSILAEDNNLLTRPETKKDSNTIEDECTTHSKTLEEMIEELGLRDTAIANKSSSMHR